MKPLIRSFQAALRAALVAALALGAIACGGEEGGRADAAEGPRTGGTLVSGVIADLTTVNPYSKILTSVDQEISSLMFLQLMEEQPDFTDSPPTMKPELAERWEIAPDGRTITFFLRDDVTWSDGEPVTAEDVRFTWQAQVSPEVGWYSNYYKANIADVEVVDPHTVRFHLKRRAVNDLQWINEGEIVPRHVWGEKPFSEWASDISWFQENLVVAGPYRLASWAPQQEIVLERNPGYYRAGLPRIDGVVIRVIADRSALLTQGLAGQLDLLIGLSVSDVERIESSDQLELLSYWSRGHVFVAWNVRDPLFEDYRVRQALTLAIDRDSIIELTYGPYGRQAISPVLSNVWAFEDDLEPYPYDPERARELLAEAGWTDNDGDGIVDKDGRPFRFELATNVGNQQRMDSTVLIQEHLERVGIAAEPRYVAFNPLMDRANKGDYQAIVMRWSMPTDLDLSFAFHTRAIALETNVFGYSNPEADRLLEKVEMAESLDEMEESLSAIQRLIYREQPMTFLYESQELMAYNRRLHFEGHPPNVLRRFWKLEEWWLAPR